MSSFGELDTFEKNAEIKPFVIEDIGRTSYDPTQYQKVLFVAPSFERMVNDLMAWLESL